MLNHDLSVIGVFFMVFIINCLIDMNFNVFNRYLGFLFSKIIHIILIEFIEIIIFRKIFIVNADSSFFVFKKYF